MRVCHFSTQDTSGGGGGFQAAYRIHVSLRQAGCSSTMVVARKLSDDCEVVQAGGASVLPKALSFLSRITSAFLRRCIDVETPFSMDLFGIPARNWRSYMRDTQIIHLHWVSRFLTSTQIRAMASISGAPIVWTLMDLAPLTGGCHYTNKCVGYVQKCGNCPQIHSKSPFDLSRWNWQRKSGNLKGVPITLVGGTRWIIDRAKESSLFRDCQTVRIPIGIDTSVFCPMDQNLARDKLGLPRDTRLIFCGAAVFSDPRKGAIYLIEALRQLRDMLAQKPLRDGQEVALIVAGKEDISKQAQLPFDTFYLGFLLGDARLALAYQAADLFVSSSIEDAGPMMIPESMLCGTPVVAFNTGGAPDLIDDQTGYLTTCKDSTDLARGMYLLLAADEEQMSTMRHKCRQVAVQEHAMEVQANRYLNLYNSLLH